MHVSGQFKVLTSDWEMAGRTKEHGDKTLPFIKRLRQILHRFLINSSYLPVNF